MIPSAEILHLLRECFLNWHISTVHMGVRGPVPVQMYNVLVLSTQFHP